VAVPAEAAFDFFAFHRLITGDYVFDCAWDKVPEVRESCGKGGTVVKDKFALPFPIGYGFFKNMVLFPKFKDFFFQFGKIYFCVNLFIHGYILPYWGIFFYMYEGGISAVLVRIYTVGKGNTPQNGEIPIEIK